MQSRENDKNLKLKLESKFFLLPRGTNIYFPIQEVGIVGYIRFLQLKTIKFC